MYTTKLYFYYIKTDIKIENTNRFNQKKFLNYHSLFSTLNLWKKLKTLFFIINNIKLIFQKQKLSYYNNIYKKKYS